MSDMIWPAPAKLNLFLHILGRREDGYHSIQTVFQMLELCDEIGFQPQAEPGIIVNANYGSFTPEDDLVYRAASLLQQLKGITSGMRISVNKRIPVGGGLGGGSSDAATTLLALNEIWDCGLGPGKLAKIGLRLGADVPVFVHGHSAWAEGIGEKLQAVVLPQDWYLVVHPGCQVDTAKIFSHPDLTRNSPPITIRDFMEGTCRNDCESVVYREFPEIAEVAGWLGRWADARLTGTGACVFGKFGSRQEAWKVLEQLPEKWQGFVSRGSRDSAVLQRVALERREKS